MKTVFLILLMLVSIFINGQENPNRKYPIEFDWQNEIANKQTKTIEDYFLLLPSSFIDCEEVYKGYPSIEKRKETINKLDAKNGYIQFQKTGQLALFKDKVNRKDIIAIQFGKCGAGNTCGALNTLLEFSDNKWIFRIDLLPENERMEDIYNRLNDDGICPYFDLPQFGTTILIRDENNDNSVIMKYEWTGQKFVRK